MVLLVSRKYNDASEIVCTVQPGSNQLDFDLEGNPPGK